MKISDRQPKISDSLKISDFSDSLGMLQHPLAPPAIRLWSYLLLKLNYGQFSVKNSIPNFRYHGNKGSVGENLTCVGKLADLENALLGARIRVVSST